VGVVAIACPPIFTISLLISFNFEFTTFYFANITIIFQFTKHLHYFIIIIGVEVGQGEEEGRAEAVLIGIFLPIYIRKKSLPDKGKRLSFSLLLSLLRLLKL